MQATLALWLEIPGERTPLTAIKFYGPAERRREGATDESARRRMAAASFTRSSIAGEEPEPKLTSILKGINRMPKLWI